MAVGNIECPNCGSTFEYDSENGFAVCPNCKTKFMVRNVKMNTTVNNYYGNNENKSNGNYESEINENYEKICLKLVSYSRHQDDDRIDSMISEITSNYSNSYFYEIINLYWDNDNLYSILSPERFYDDKHDFYKSIENLEESAVKILIRSIEKEGYKLTDNQSSLIRDSDDSYIMTNIEEAIDYLQNYFNVVFKLENDKYIKKLIKYDFEEEHYDSIIKNKDDAVKLLNKYKDLNNKLGDFLENNKLKCVAYLTDLENAKINSADTTYYTLGVDKGSKTGIVCDILGWIFFLIGIIALVILCTNSGDPGITPVLYVIGFICMYIGILRYNNCEKIDHWWVYLILYPVIPFLSLVYTIKTVIAIKRSKESYKRATSIVEKIERNIASYKNKCTFNSLKDMLKAFNYDLNEIR